MFTTSRKHRQFDLQNRLGRYSHLKPSDKERIKFGRLPKKRVRSVWWLVISFAVVLYFFFYLSNN